jgi:hypothetical protein
MNHRTFVACALVVLVLELLALDRQPLPGPSTAEVERLVAGAVQTRYGPVSDVRCVRGADDAATCVALMYDGSRSRVAASIDPETGEVTPKLERHTRLPAYR